MKRENKSEIFGFVFSLALKKQIIIKKWNWFVSSRKQLFVMKAKKYNKKTTNFCFVAIKFEIFSKNCFHFMINYDIIFLEKIKMDIKEKIQSMQEKLENACQCL